jgi:hypothetical protein
MANRYMTRWSMQMEAIISYRLTLVCMAGTKIANDNKGWLGCGQREPLYNVGGNANWYSHYGKVPQKN